MSYLKIVLTALLFSLLCCQSESIIMSLLEKESSDITQCEIMRLFEAIDSNEMVNNVEYSEVVNELVFKSLSGNTRGFVNVYSDYFVRDSTVCKSIVCKSIDSILQYPLGDGDPYWNISNIQKALSSFNTSSPSVQRILNNLYVANQ